jgi:hypothetical protein
MTFQVRTLRRALLATCAFAVVSLSLATPALADGGRWGRHYGGGNHYWHPPFPPLPRVVVGLPLPPFIVLGGPRPRDYRDGYGYGYDRRDRGYDRGYQDGYDDGYRDDRGRSDWRRERGYRGHRDCDRDDGYY